MKIYCKQNNTELNCIYSNMLMYNTCQHYKVFNSYSEEFINRHNSFTIGLTKCNLSHGNDSSNSYGTKGPHIV